MFVIASRYPLYEETIYFIEVVFKNFSLKYQYFLIPSSIVISYI